MAGISYNKQNKIHDPVGQSGRYNDFKSWCYYSSDNILEKHVSSSIRKNTVGALGSLCIPSSAFHPLKDKCRHWLSCTLSQALYHVIGLNCPNYPPIWKSYLFIYIHRWGGVEGGKLFKLIELYFCLAPDA